MEKAPTVQSKSVRGGRGARGRGRGKKRAHGFNRGKFTKQIDVEPQVQPIFTAEEELQISQLKNEAMQASKRRGVTLNRISSWLSSNAGAQEGLVLSLFKPNLQTLCAGAGLLDAHLEQHKTRITLECLREVGALCLPLGSASETISLIELVKKAASNKQADIKRLANEILDRWKQSLKDLCVNLVDPNLGEDPWPAITSVINEKERERRGITGTGAETMNPEAPLPASNPLDATLALGVDGEGEGEGDLEDEDEGEEESDMSD